MKRTTIFVDEAIEKDLKVLARRQGRTAAAVIRDALARYVRDQVDGPGLALRIVGLGASGHRDTAETHEDLLWAEIEPHGEVPRGRAGKRPGPRVSAQPAGGGPGTGKRRTRKSDRRP